MNARLADDGAKVDAFYDRTELVGTTLHTVGHNLLEGALLVTLVLFVVPARSAGRADRRGRSSRSRCWSSFIYLKLRGMSANLLSMGAVDFGVIVDGGVVIIESILTSLGTRRPGESPHARYDPDERIRARHARGGPPDGLRAADHHRRVPAHLHARSGWRAASSRRWRTPWSRALVGALLFSVTWCRCWRRWSTASRREHRESPVLRWAAGAYEPTLRVRAAAARGWCSPPRVRCSGGTVVVMPHGWARSSSPS